MGHNYLVITFQWSVPDFTVLPWIKIASFSFFLFLWSEDQLVQLKLQITFCLTWYNIVWIGLHPLDWAFTLPTSLAQRLWKPKFGSDIRYVTCLITYNDCLTARIHFYIMSHDSCILIICLFFLLISQH